jgi:hypothetical protein
VRRKTRTLGADQEHAVGPARTEHPLGVDIPDRIIFRQERMGGTACIRDTRIAVAAAEM